MHVAPLGYGQLEWVNEEVLVLEVFLHFLVRGHIAIGTRSASLRIRPLYRVSILVLLVNLNPEDVLCRSWVVVLPVRMILVLHRGQVKVNHLLLVRATVSKRQSRVIVNGTVNEQNPLRGMLLYIR